jgi:O6-methylguanine-DNA--protein-cysteine methyltransferase
MASRIDKLLNTLTAPQEQLPRLGKKLRANIVRTVGLEKANEVVEGHLDMLGQLRKINRAITEELDRAKAEVVEADGRSRIALQGVIIKLSAEIRRQLEAQLKIFEVWTDMKVVAEFQKEVLAVLDEVEPGVRDEIVRRLKERHALRGAVSVS